MKTEFWKMTGEDGADLPGLERAAEIIRQGGLVAIPTETVYGLAGSALLSESAEKIYTAKGRPADNPLIVHVSDPQQAESLAYTSDLYYRLAKAFMPGPLTVILKKKEPIPSTVTAGGDTVAIRCPAHPIANRLIAMSGHPIAAPSANRSGIPSPTCAQHVLEDMNGRIDMILDGGPCEIGLESTVIRLDDEESCTILRPGAVTPEMLSTVCKNVSVSAAVTDPASVGDSKPESPGMKYKHYAPSAQLLLIDGNDDAFFRYVHDHASGKYGVMLAEEDGEKAGAGHALLIGPKADLKEQARRFFNLLRQADEMGLETVFAQLPKAKGYSLALYNRIVRAAGCQIIKADEQE